MRNLAASIVGEMLAMGASGAFLTLLEVAVPDDDPLRLCNDTDPQTWGGETWEAFPFSVQPPNEAAEAAQPRAVIRVADVLRTLQLPLQTHEGLANQQVTVRVVHSDHLAEDAILTAVMTIRQTRITQDAVEFVVTPAAMPAMGQFPRARYIPNFCRFRFRAVGCGFASALIEGCECISFEDADPDTITLSEGSDWADLGFAPGTMIRVSGSTANDGDYLVECMCGLVLTLDSDEELTAEAAGAAVTVQALCRHTLADCIALGNSDSFGGSPGAGEGLYVH